MSNHRNSAVSPGTYDASRAVATLIRQRLSQEELVTSAVKQSAARAENPFEWGGASLGKGHTGVALLQLSLAKSMDGGGSANTTGAAVSAGGVGAKAPADAAGSAWSQSEWFAQAQAQLRHAADSTHTHPLTTASLLLGSSGLALAVEEFRQVDDRYAPSARRLRQQLAEQVSRYLWPIREKGYAAADYDVISGAAGVLGALLSVHEAPSEIWEAVDVLVRYLLDVVGRANNDLSCRVPPDLFPLVEYREQYPFGYYNIGLSHGICGVLSAPAAAYRAGHDGPDICAVLHRLADRLLDWSMLDLHGPDWPAGVPLTEAGAPDLAKSVPTRTAWCYGTPGVAVALLQVGKALTDTSLQSTAVAAHRAAMARVRATPETVTSPTICHGLAGLLCVARFFVEQTGDATARDDVHWLKERLLAQCDPAYPLVVQDEESTGNFVDDPSFLTGAAGVALSLLSADGNRRQLWWNGLMLHG